MLSYDAYETVFIILIVMIVLLPLYTNIKLYSQYKSNLFYKLYRGIFWIHMNKEFVTNGGWVVISLHDLFFLD